LNRPTHGQFLDFRGCWFAGLNPRRLRVVFVLAPAIPTRTPLFPFSRSLTPKVVRAVSTL
jgi:hypothetical protein